jgi:hypothetical protein
MLTTANKWLLISKSHGDSNRCTPCRGNLTNTAHASHARSTYGPRPCVSHATFLPKIMRLVRTQLPFQNNKRISGEKPSSCWQSTTRLTRPISPACDWYVQYLLMEANPSVLNRHRRGLQPPKGPTQSQVIQSQHSLKWKWCETYCQPVVFWPLSAYRGLYLHLAMANVIQIPAMSSRVTRKVFIVQLRFQSTPINLMHNHS